MVEILNNATFVNATAINKNTQDAYEKICERLIDNYNILEEDPVLGPTNLDDPISTRVTISEIIHANDESKRQLTLFKLTFFDGEILVVDSNILKASLKDSLKEFLDEGDDEELIKATDNLDCEDEARKELTICIPSNAVRKLKSSRQK